MRQNNSGYAIALGMFDGMHIGHRTLIEQTVAFAEKNGCKSMVYTFTNHPLAVLGRDPGALMTVEERTDRMKKLGVDTVVMLPFSLEFAAMPPEAFLAQLVERYHMRAAFAGFNYTFGDRGKGDEPLLRNYGGKHGFSVHILQPVLYDGLPVSSTRVRKAILSGDVEAAGAMLGEPYPITGVISERIEKRYLFSPNAQKVIPGSGLYTAEVADRSERFFTVRAEVNDGGIAVISDRDLMAGRRDVPLRFLQRLSGR